MTHAQSEPVPASDTPPAELVQQVRRAAFHGLLTGAPVTTADLAARTALPVPVVASAVDTLVASNRAVTDEDGNVIGAAGLSLVATSHELRIDNGMRLWCWCAWDALGIPSALLLTAEATTVCGTCGRPLTVTIVNGQLVGQGAEQGFLPAPKGSPLTCFCPYALLFCSADHLQSWRGTLRSGVPGEVLPITRYAATARHGWSWAAPPAEPR